MGRKRRTQIAPGRVKGVPNLKKTHSGVVNQHGISFSFEEKKALENAVRYANRKRKKLLQTQAALIRYSEGRPIGKVGDLHAMGEEGDFILARKSSSLQGFKTRESYEKYMGYLTRVRESDYIDNRIELYKNNFGGALIEAFGDDAEELLDRIIEMSPREFANKVVQTDEDLDIGFIYLPGERGKKLNQIRKALGLDPVEYNGDDEVINVKPRKLRERLKQGR